jgi:hypothetical protein
LLLGIGLALTAAHSSLRVWKLGPLAGPGANQSLRPARAILPQDQPPGTQILIMGSLKKRRKAKINRHKRRKKLRAHRHKKRTWQK